MYIKFICHHHHHHVHEGLGVFPVPWSSICSWSLHLFLRRPTFLRPFGVYCSASFGSLFVSILYTCCSHFLWYCFISSTMFCAPVFSLIHWFFSLSSFVIHVSVSKFSSVLLLNVVPIFSSVPKLHFQISMLKFISNYFYYYMITFYKFTDVRKPPWPTQRIIYFRLTDFRAILYNIQIPLSLSVPLSSLRRLKKMAKRKYFSYVHKTGTVYFFFWNFRHRI